MLPPVDAQIVGKSPFQAGRLVSWNTLQSRFQWLWKGEKMERALHSRAVLWVVQWTRGTSPTFFLHRVQLPPVHSGAGFRWEGGDQLP